MATSKPRKRVRKSRRLLVGKAVVRKVVSRKYPGFLTKWLQDLEMQKGGSEQSQNNQSKIFARSFTGNVTTFCPMGKVLYQDIQQIPFYRTDLRMQPLYHACILKYKFSICKVNFNYNYTGSRSISLPLQCFKESFKLKNRCRNTPEKFIFLYHSLLKHTLKKRGPPRREG
jgi:hypothetical protein